jgi:hypothetical protein
MVGRGGAVHGAMSAELTKRAKAIIALDDGHEFSYCIPIENMAKFIYG